MVDCYEHVKEPMIHKRQFLDSILDTVPLNFLPRNYNSSNPVP